MRIPNIMLIALTLATMTPVTAAETTTAPSPLSGHSFPFYYSAPDPYSGVVDVHRGILTFGRNGATCELFPGGISIPYTGTLSSQPAGKRGTKLKNFDAKGQASLDSGTIAFTASMDGEGAKGSVSVSHSGGAPITISFQGTPSVK